MCSADEGVERSHRLSDIGHVGNLRVINELAATQHGAFSLRQARLAGFDSDAVARRLRNGEWLRLDHSVYAAASSRPTWHRSLSAALLSRPAAVLTHESASALFGLPGFDKGAPVLLEPRGSNTRSSIARLFETDQFDRIATTEIDGLAVTTVPETILILARDTPAHRIEEVFDEALIRGALDLGAMARTIDREAGRRTPGTPLLRRLTTSRRPTAPSKSSSYLEALTERLLRDPSFPPWTRQSEFSLGDVEARVDFYVPSARLVIEADGRNWHSRRRDFETDRQRDNALAARGIQVLRFTYEMLTKDPESCRQQLLATILVRAA